MIKIWTILKFEFLNMVRNKAFIGTTIVMVLLGAIGPMVPNVVGLFRGDTESKTIAVVNNTDWVNEEILGMYLSPDIFMFDNIEEARQAVIEGNINYAVELSHAQYNLYIESTGVSVGELYNQLSAMFRDRHRAEQFLELDMDENLIQGILNFEPVAEVTTIGDATEDVGEFLGNNMMNFAYAFVMNFILYFALLTGGQNLIMTVIREKSTKTMELLITSCKSDHLINGKVLGTGGANLLQLLLFLAVTGLSMNINGGLNPELFVIDMRGDIFAFMIIFFLLGFATYSYIYAALASTATRMEDAGVVTLPTLLVMIGFIAASFGIVNPNAGWFVIMSHIPFFAPFVMFSRICFGTAPGWEIAVSIVVQIINVIILAWLSSRIYRLGVLMYGNTPSLKMVAKMLSGKD